MAAIVVLRSKKHAWVKGSTKHLYVTLKELAVKVEGGLDPLITSTRSEDQGTRFWARRNGGVEPLLFDNVTELRDLIMTERPKILLAFARDQFDDGVQYPAATAVGEDVQVLYRYLESP